MGDTKSALIERVEVLGGTLTSKDGQQFVQIQPEPLVLGRAAGCALVINDPKVSSAHVEITATPLGVRIRDLGSRNGTFVEEHRSIRDAGMLDSMRRNDAPLCAYPRMG
jgi:pSer/pThr/pTyr-binding forkhead associated (FHA) protein